MIIRNENGEITAAEKLSDITSELKSIEKKLSAAMKKKEKPSEEEEAELVQAAADMKTLFEIISPELQKTSNPMELLSFLKQVAKMKELAEKMKELKND